MKEIFLRHFYIRLFGFITNMNWSLQSVISVLKTNSPSSYITSCISFTLGALYESLFCLLVKPTSIVTYDMKNMTHTLELFNVRVTPFSLVLQMSAATYSP